MTYSFDNRVSNQKLLILVLFLFLFQNFSLAYGNDRAIDSLRLALDTTDDSAERLRTLMAIGNYQETESFEYKEAFMTYEKVRKLAKKNKNTVTLAEAVYRQALMLMAMGEMTAASGYFDSILRVSKEDNLKELVLLGNQGKGQFYFENKEYEEAIKSLDLATQAAKEIEDQEALLELYYLQSKVQIKLQNFDKASEFLEMAQASLKNSELPSKHVFLKGQIAYNNAQVLDAMSYYKEALAMAENSGQFFVQLEVLQILIDFYSRQDQWEEVKPLEKKKNHILNTKPAQLNESHLGEVVYFHAYQEVSSVKGKKSRNQVIYISLVALFLFAFGIYIIKRQSGYLSLIKSVKEAQLKFTQERYEKYTKN